MDQLRAMAAAAGAADVVLLHENESDIYGEKPDGVKDIFATVASDHLKPTTKGRFVPARETGERKENLVRLCVRLNVQTNT